LTVSIDGTEIGSVTRDTGGWYDFTLTEAGEFTVDEGGEHVIRIESPGPPLNFDRLVVADARTTSTGA
jgi:hypothetical protein